MGTLSIYLNIILAVFVLHASFGIYLRSRNEYPKEPWIVLTGHSDARFGYIVRSFLNLCGFLTMLFSVLVPSGAVYLYLYIFDFSFFQYTGVVTFVCLVLQLVSIVYISYSVMNLNTLRPQGE